MYNNITPIPFMTMELVEKYCVEEKYEPPKYKIGDVLLCRKDSMTYKAEILNVLHFPKRYAVKVFSGRYKNYPCYDTVLESDLFVAEEYFYYTSSGKIGKAYIGVDPKADYFRKHTKNFFTTKQDCENYIQRILSNYK